MPLPAQIDPTAVHPSHPSRQGRRRLPPGERRQAADRRARRLRAVHARGRDAAAARSRRRRCAGRRSSSSAAATSSASRWRRCSCRTGVDATVTVCHSRTRDLASHTRRADVLVAAIGRGALRDGRHGQARRRRHRRRHESHRRPDDEDGDAPRRRRGLRRGAQRRGRDHAGARRRRPDDDRDAAREHRARRRQQHGLGAGDAGARRRAAGLVRRARTRWTSSHRVAPPTPPRRDVGEALFGPPRGRDGIADAPAPARRGRRAASQARPAAPAAPAAVAPAVPAAVVDPYARPTPEMEAFAALAAAAGLDALSTEAEVSAAFDAAVAQASTPSTGIPGATPAAAVPSRC